MKKKEKISRTEIKEFGRISTLEKLFEQTPYSNHELIFGGKENEVATSNKSLLEGVDFDLTYTPIKYLGYRAVINAIGELYAHCYVPQSISFTIGLSSKFSFEHLNWLWNGALAAAKEHNIKNCTLDIIPSMTGLIINSSAIGEKNSALISKRAKAKSGDLICVIGNLGASYMGLHVLEREKVAFNASKEYKQPDLSKYKYLLSRYLTPELESDVPKIFKEIGVAPSDGKFVVRGLGDSVKTICKRNNLGAKIFIEKIPVASATREMAEELGIDIITAIINGGDDHRLLYIIPLEDHEKIQKEFKGLEIIGHLTKDLETVLITPEGAEIEIKAQGWS